MLNTPQIPALLWICDIYHGRFYNKCIFCIVKPANEQVKQQIIVASITAFKRYGFNKIAMEDIAKACGKSRSTLYHYFKNKIEVLDAVVVDIFSKTFQLATKDIDAYVFFIIYICL